MNIISKKNAPIVINKLISKNLRHTKKIQVPYSAETSKMSIKPLSMQDIIHQNNINLIFRKTLSENIEFKPATKREEAENYGKSVLGIKNYLGFNEQDLDVVNWINQGLVYVNNKTKGKSVMPTKIYYHTFEKQPGSISQGSMNHKGIMVISKEYINRIKNIVKIYYGDMPNAQEFFKRLDATSNFMRWMNAYIKILNTETDLGEQIYRNVHTSTFSVISHEMGHLQHCVNTQKNLIELDRNFSKEFSQNKQTAKSISDYAAESPTEFVAECFSKMVDEIKLDDNVMTLYKKLGGKTNNFSNTYKE